MRKIRAFSSSMRFSTQGEHSSGERSSFSDGGDVTREVKTFANTSLIKLNINEMKRSINIRFLRLIRSCKSYAKSVKDVQDLVYLKQYMVMQLTYMLSEYADMLSVNPSLQLSVYLKVNSVVPQAKASTIKLSRVMIIASRLKKSQGILPSKNQKDLQKAMDDFIRDVINSVINPINPTTKT